MLSNLHEKIAMTAKINAALKQNDFQLVKILVEAIIEEVSTISLHLMRI